MKFTLTYKGESREVNIPTRWEELTFQQFLQIQEVGNDWMKVFAIFTGIPAADLEKVKHANIDDMLVAATFLLGEMPNQLPATILGYKIPTDLGFESFGQYKIIKEDVEQSKQKQLTETQQIARYAMYVATYACSEKYGDDWGWEQAEEMAQDFLNAPAPEVLAVGNFTLLKLIGLSRPIGSGYQRQSTRKTRMKRAIHAWWLSLVFTVQSWRWRRKLT